MKISQNLFNLNIDKNFLFEKNPKIAVAVSGGPDSMCLLFLLNNWIKVNKGNLAALIINHNIRLESYQEAKNIKKNLLKYQINSKIFNINKININKKTMKEARDNRFKELIKYCNKNKILHLFLGHHYDDNLETYLLRKAAGSNFEGLQSMQNKMIKNGIQIIRPLLNIEKKDILDFNRIKKIEFIIDPSNKDVQYSRVAVRNFIKENPEYTKDIKKDFENIKKLNPLYKRMIFNVLNQVTIKFNKRKIIVNSQYFLKQQKEIQSKIIHIIYQYLKQNKSSLRYEKIISLLEVLSKKDCIKTNLGGMTIRKDEFLINFTI